jgi:hypothetical protein
MKTKARSLRWRALCQTVPLYRKDTCLERTIGYVPKRTIGSVPKDCPLFTGFTVHVTDHLLAASCLHVHVGKKTSLHVKDVYIKCLASLIVLFSYGVLLPQALGDKETTVSVTLCRTKAKEAIYRLSQWVHYKC